MNPARPRTLPFALLVTALLVGGMALLLGLNTASAAEELRRTDLLQRNSDLAAQVTQLDTQVRASAAPAALARAAGQLGMVPNPVPAFLERAADGSVRLLGDPVPATRPAVAAPAAPVGTGTVHAVPSTSPAATAAASPAASPTASPTTSANASTTAPATSGAATRSAPAPGPSRSVHTTSAPNAPVPTLTLAGGPR